MTVVIGTAGHIDHGKTALLRALTGIDADRLPEERRRGMTIDVGYAHLDLADGTSLDFVDVPGHDRLVGNMLVGAGEIDAALVVVAADDGPRAQTWEHIALLDALGIAEGLAVVTKTDVVDAGRVAEVSALVRLALARTALAGARVLAASSVSGDGLEPVLEEIIAVRERVERAAGPAALPRLAIDRVFPVKGRGTVVTGTLRGGPVAPGDSLRVVPGAGEVRVREVQVHGRPVDRASGGRTALNVAGADATSLRRGVVLTTDPGVVATERVLAAVAAGVRIPGEVRLHLATDAVEAMVARGRRETVELADGRRVRALRLVRPVAAAPGDRVALRRLSPVETIGGGTILDASPPRGVSTRRMTPERLRVLVDADATARPAARLDLHGALAAGHGVDLAVDVASALDEAAGEAVRRRHEAQPEGIGLPIADLRADLERRLRRLVTLDRAAATAKASEVIERLVADGRLARAGDRVAAPDRAGALPPAMVSAMDRLEQALAVAAPPHLADAARAAGCPPDGVRALEAAGRIVRLADDLAWAAATYRALESAALALARERPLTPAALRDATGTSRRYVMVILDDLNRREILTRSAAGHVPGPRAPATVDRRAS